MNETDIYRELEVEEEEVVVNGDPQVIDSFFKDLEKYYVPPNPLTEPAPTPREWIMKQKARNRKVFLQPPPGVPAGKWLASMREFTKEVFPDIKFEFGKVVVEDIDEIDLSGYPINTEDEIAGKSLEREFYNAAITMGQLGFYGQEVAEVLQGVEEYQLGYVHGFFDKMKKSYKKTKRRVASAVGHAVKKTYGGSQKVYEKAAHAALSSGKSAQRQWQQVSNKVTSAAMRAKKGAKGYSKKAVNSAVNKTKQAIAVAAQWAKDMMKKIVESMRKLSAAAKKLTDGMKLVSDSMMAVKKKYRKLRTRIAEIEKKRLKFKAQVGALDLMALSGTKRKKKLKKEYIQKLDAWHKKYSKLVSAYKQKWTKIQKAMKKASDVYFKAKRQLAKVKDLWKKLTGLKSKLKIGALDIKSVLAAALMLVNPAVGTAVLIVAALARSRAEVDASDDWPEDDPDWDFDDYPEPGEDDWVDEPEEDYEVPAEEDEEPEEESEIEPEEEPEEGEWVEGEDYYEDDEEDFEDDDDDWGFDGMEEYHVDDDVVEQEE